MPQHANQLPLDLSAHFSHFRAAHEADGDRLHFAAHSHHFWPDVTRAAQIRCWDDAARLSDDKWEHILGDLWGDVRTRIAGHLKLPDPSTLVLAPNTHELLVRLLSCLPQNRPARILTTDSEFHSFHRQAARLAEEGLVDLTIVAAELLVDFEARFIGAARQAASPDMVFLSQVYFNSGLAHENLDRLVSALGDLDSLIVIDGYHGFLARPTDLSAIAARAFYLAGGYKYAMAGEGACFMHCPPDIAMRPRNTGWFAGFSALSQAQNQVAYAQGGWRFMGSTFDPSGLCRLHAALNWLAGLGIDAGVIHGHARALQKKFVAGLENQRPGPFEVADLVAPVEAPAIGNFLTFRNAQAQDRFTTLRDNGIVVDVRGDRLRVGFGLYQNVGDVERLLCRLSELRQG